MPPAGRFSFAHGAQPRPAYQRPADMEVVRLLQRLGLIADLGFPPNAPPRTAHFRRASVSLHGLRLFSIRAALLDNLSEAAAVGGVCRRTGAPDVLMSAVRLGSGPTQKRNGQARGDCWRGAWPFLRLTPWRRKSDHLLRSDELVQVAIVEGSTRYFELGGCMSLSTSWRRSQARMTKLGV
jgi:hypothetical protein